MAFVINWNCRGLLNNLSDIKDILATYSPVALCLQETNLSPLHVNILKKYKVFRRDREQACRLSGGVAIIVKNNIAAREHRLKTRLEAVAATLITYKTITICSIYIEPHLKITLHDIEDLFSQLPDPCVVVGDFNAHSSFWGSEKTDTRGQILEDFILCNNICLLNTGKPTYCSPSSGKMSFIDLSFCSSSVLSDFKWDVLDNPHGSDHLPTTISLTSSPSIIQTKPRCWKLHLADWKLFKEKADLRKLFAEDFNVDELNERFTSCILAAARQAIPQSSGVVRQNCKVWWTKDCREAKKKQNKAWSIFRRYPTQENLLIFKKARAKARYVRRTAEKASCSITSLL